MIRVPLALLLAAALLCSLCGCGFLYDENEISQILGASDPVEEGDAPTSDGKEKIFSLSYYTEEPLDPYTASSHTNSELLRLCYSGLFALDENYDPVLVMAESYSWDGTEVRIRIRSDIRFSDGSPVTAADCVASYERAARNGSVWRSRFSYIRSYHAADEKTFCVAFRASAASNLNLLTVPVVKADSLSGDGLPVGCGRYRISSGQNPDLVRTDCGVHPGEYLLDTVALLGIADREALIYNFNYGRLQAVCADLSLGTAEYRSDSELVTVPTNRFTFLTVNKSRKELADPNFVKGITYLLDRAAIVRDACGTFATPVWSPLNPAWSVTKEADLNPDIRSVTLSTAAFDALFPMEGTVRVYEKEPVSLRILVNRENATRVRTGEMVAETLRGAGFTVELVSVTWDEYRTSVRDLDFDLYLGEVDLPANMDLSSLYTSDVCNTGEKEGTYAALDAISDGVLAGTVDARTFVSEFQNLLPFIPLYYSKDALAVNMEVIGSFGNSVSELYWGIENWAFSSADELFQ